MKQILNNLNKLAKDKHIENKKYFDKLKKKRLKNLDYVMQDLHDAEFKKRTVCNVLIVAKQRGHCLLWLILKESQNHLDKNRSSL